MSPFFTINFVGNIKVYKFGGLITNGHVAEGIGRGPQNLQWRFDSVRGNEWGSFSSKCSSFGVGVI